MVHSVVRDVKYRNHEYAAFVILMRPKRQKQSALKLSGRIIPQSGGLKTRGSTDQYKQCYALY